MRHHLAVLDEAGLIITVNKAWRQLADANGLAWDDYGVGRNYLEVCEFAEGDNAIGWCGIKGHPGGHDKSARRMVIGISVP